jgi:hypothetical protein
VVIVVVVVVESSDGIASSDVVGRGGRDSMVAIAVVASSGRVESRSIITRDSYPLLPPP